MDTILCDYYLLKLTINILYFITYVSMSIWKIQFIVLKSKRLHLQTKYYIKVVKRRICVGRAYKICKVRILQIYISPKYYYY